MRVSGRVGGAWAIGWPWMAVAAWLLIASWMVSGCGLKYKDDRRAAAAGGPGAGAGVGAGAAALRWPFEPERVSIHPLTRVVADGSAIEAHFEFFDAWGDSTKPIGSVLIEMYRAGAAGEEQAARWRDEIGDGAAASRRFDRVTRTVRYRLELPGAASGELRVRLIRPDGTVLIASRELNS